MVIHGCATLAWSSSSDKIMSSGSYLSFFFFFFKPFARSSTSFVADKQVIGSGRWSPGRKRYILHSLELPRVINKFSFPSWLDSALSPTMWIVCSISIPHPITGGILRMSVVTFKFICNNRRLRVLFIGLVLLWSGLPHDFETLNAPANAEFYF